MGQTGKGVSTTRAGLGQAVVKATFQVEQVLPLLLKILRRVSQATSQPVKVLVALITVLPNLDGGGRV